MASFSSLEKTLYTISAAVQFLHNKKILTLSNEGITMFCSMGRIYIFIGDLLLTEINTSNNTLLLTKLINSTGITLYTELLFFVFHEIHTIFIFKISCTDL